MPNCPDLPGTTSAVRERVIPDDGRHENRYVLLFVLLILVVATVGIVLRQPASSPAPTIELGHVQQQQLTELTIAMAEARFMMNGEHAPALNELAEAGVAPFADESWHTLAEGCWLGPVSDSGRWLLSLPANGIFLQLTSDEREPDCLTPDNWILMTS